MIPLAAAMALMAVVICLQLPTGILEETAQPAAETKIIRPVFPKPIFISAPWDCRLPNFEKTWTVKKEFTAPQRTQVISRNKPVTSSRPPDIGRLDLIVDDNAGTDDQSEVHFVSVPVWIQIDLQAEAEIDQIWIWHGEGTLARRQTPEVFEDVIVQIASDPQFQSGVITIFNSDDDGSIGQGKGTDPTYMEANYGRGIAVGGKRARYVRVWGGKAYSGGPCRFTEVTVWGR